MFLAALSVGDMRKSIISSLYPCQKHFLESYSNANFPYFKSPVGTKYKKYWYNHDNFLHSQIRYHQEKFHLKAKEKIRLPGKFYHSGKIHRNQ